jgi:hypothetical protein
LWCDVQKTHVDNPADIIILVCLQLQDLFMLKKKSRQTVLSFSGQNNYSCVITLACLPRLCVGAGIRATLADPAFSKLQNAVWVDLQMQYGG